MYLFTDAAITVTAVTTVTDNVKEDNQNELVIKQISENSNNVSHIEIDVSKVMAI